MNDELIERLRLSDPDCCWPCGEWGCKAFPCPCECHSWAPLMAEAADEIERLRALVGPDHESEPVQNMNDEVTRLRALINEWDEAERAYFDTPLLRRGRARAALTRATLARIALRKAVGR
ncbi:MAG: hypothetical protein KGR18_10150 [Acidobacteria bacterium]|nr:hypothetical protein [Acidobacteriota bacterium]